MSWQKHTSLDVNLGLDPEQHKPLHLIWVKPGTFQMGSPNGGRRARTLYKPFGEVRYQSGALPTEYRAASPQRSEGDTFTGQYSHVDDFGLLYYVARWYDPALGRFVQADTVVPGMHPMAFDRHAYVMNSPLQSRLCFSKGTLAAGDG